MRPITFPTVALALAVTTPAAPRLPAQALGRPVAEWSNDFSRVTGAAELPDGRVVIVDSRDGLVFMGAARGGTATQLGRTGEGPNEYQRPFSVFHGLADTLLVYANARLLRIAPNGTLSGSHAFTPRGLGGGVAPPRGTDTEGRVYWDRVVIRVPGSDAIKRQQQYEIVRFKPGTETVEVVATASDHAPELHEQQFHPFAQRDAWVLDPNGSIGIVRARDYSLQWVRKGAPARTGTPIPVQPVAITAADREAYRRDRAANPSGAAPGGRAPAPRDGDVTPEAMQRMREAYPDAQFPTHKPPFVERGAFRSPGGQIWVVRSPTTAALKGNRVDVLDASGRRVRELELPAGRHLLALERTGVYLVREDDDGLQYLERYAYPQGLR